MAGIRLRIGAARAAAAAFALCCHVAFAAPVPLERYQVTRYDQDDGAPAAATDMTQTSDGFIWAVSSSTLHRFDGTRFERWKSRDGRPPPTEGVLAFTAGRDDALWSGAVGGGISAIRGNEARIYGAPQGLPNASNKRSILALLADGERVLAATRGGLYALEGERWVAYTPVPELADKPVDDLLRDRAGRLWIKTPEAIHVIDADGAARKLPLPAGPDTIASGLVSANDGDPWYWSHGKNLLCRIVESLPAPCWRADEISRPIFDRAGMLWWSRPKALMRLVDVATLDAKDPEDLMRRAESRPIEGSNVFEARDGAIWAFGSAGLARLRSPVGERTETPSGGLAGGDGGSVWLASYTRGLMHVGDAGAAPGPVFRAEDGTLWTAAAKAGDPTATFTPAARAPAPHQAIVLERHIEQTRAAVHIEADPLGGFFVLRVAPPGLTHVVDGRERVIALPEIDRGGVPRAVQRDSAGRLWLAIGRNQVPLYRLDGERWIPNGDLPVPTDLLLNGFGFDAKDTAWIASGRTVVAIDAHGVRRYGRDEGLDVGSAGKVVIAPDSVWAYGTRGVAVLRGERFLTLTGAGGEAFLETTGFVMQPDGDVWLAGAEGVSRIAAQQWRNALATGAREVKVTRLDHWDGIDPPALSGPFPAAARSADGTLWFAMRDGLYRLRPDTLPPPEPAPRVVVKTLTVDDETRALSDDLAFAPGTWRIAFDYSAPSAQRPERTRFRYRFSRNGEWDPWRLADSERQLAFNRLGHGDYALEISASGRDGDWSDTPTQVRFRVLPAFHQTPAFYALVAAALALVLALVYVARVRRLAARIRGEMTARLRERERIARDLHDTLLQGMQGLLLSFQGIAGKLASDDPLRERIERVLNRTEDVLREGRDRVGALRDPQAGTLDLADSLQRHARDLAAEKKLLCEVAVPHQPRPLAPDAYEELLQVGREAIGNALRHSGGQTVRATLAYTDDGVLLAVVDDGIGLPADAGRAEGRWGIRGMHERAQLIDALLTVRRRAEGGTEVKMFVPAARAYAGAKP